MTPRAGIAPATAGCGASRAGLLGRLLALTEKLRDLMRGPARLRLGPSRQELHVPWRRRRLRLDLGLAPPEKSATPRSGRRFFRGLGLRPWVGLWFRRLPLGLGRAAPGGASAAGGRCRLPLGLRPPPRPRVRLRAARRRLGG